MESDINTYTEYPDGTISGVKSVYLTKEELKEKSNNKAMSLLNLDINKYKVIDINYREIKQSNNNDESIANEVDMTGRDNCLLEYKLKVKENIKNDIYDVRNNMFTQPRISKYVKTLANIKDYDYDSVLYDSKMHELIVNINSYIKNTKANALVLYIEDDLMQSNSERSVNSLLLTRIHIYKEILNELKPLVDYIYFNYNGTMLENVLLYSIYSAIEYEFSNDEVIEFNEKILLKEGFTLAKER